MAAISQSVEYYVSLMRSVDLNRKLIIETRCAPSATNDQTRLILKMAVDSTTIASKYLVDKYLASGPDNRSSASALAEFESNKLQYDTLR